MSKLIDIKEASELLGLNPKTLRRWDDEGKLKAIRTFGNHRRYKLEDIEAIINSTEIEQNNQRNVFIYCRVSTNKQKESGKLLRQKERLVQYCNERQYNIVHIFEETASGLNDKRRELTKMFRRLSEVDTIIVEYPDRLARFGFNYLKEFSKSLNVNIEIIEEKSKAEPNEEMVNDLISVVTCFSTRMYGARGGRKAKKDIEKTIKELKKERGENSKNSNESNSSE
jgi:excisionase family DNA binding protein